MAEAALDAAGRCAVLRAARPHARSALVTRWRPRATACRSRAGRASTWPCRSRDHLGVPALHRQHRDCPRRSREASTDDPGPQQTQSVGLKPRLGWVALSVTHPLRLFRPVATRRQAFLSARRPDRRRSVTPYEPAVAETLPDRSPSERRKRSRDRGLRTLQPERIVTSTLLTSNPPAALRSYSPMADLVGRGGQAGGDLARA